MEVTMSLTQIVLRFAGAPGNPYGNDDQGYVVTAPLDDHVRLDVDAWKRQPKVCTVVGFKGGDDRHSNGLLIHRSDNWFVHFAEDSDEPDYRLGKARLTIGQYVIFDESNGRSLTYRVSEHHPVGCDALELTRSAAREASAEW
jgi:hypothetical protein